MASRQPWRIAATKNVIQPVNHILRSICKDIKVSREKPTGPICSRSQSDTRDHEEAAWGLNHHHGYAQCTNKFHAVRMQQLWSILSCCQDSRGDAKERSPRRDPLGNGAIRRWRNGNEKVDGNDCDAKAG